MSTTYLARINIDSTRNFVEIERRTIKQKLRGIDFSNLVFDSRTISFTLWGYNGMDYQCLEEIKAFLKQRGHNFEIACGEYVESDGGFYYDSNDDEGEKEQIKEEVIMG